MANLTKRDLVMQISKSTGITQQEVFEVIQQTLDGITEALATGRDVELRNFGVFEVRLTKSRVGRNPNKPENDVVIPARATVKFNPVKSCVSAFFFALMNFVEKATPQRQPEATN